MARPRTAASRAIASLTNFSRGLVTNRPVTLISPSEARIAENVDLRYGYVRGRTGWVALNTIAPPSGDDEPVRDLFVFFDESGAHKLLALAGTTLMQSSGADFSKIGSLGATLPVRAQFTQVSTPSGAKTGYVAWSANGTPQQLYSTNGTNTLAALASAPTGDSVIFHGNALWVGAGNTSSFPNRIYFSRRAPNHETFPALNYIDIDTTAGDKIVGFANVFGALVILKQRSIHKITGQQPDDNSTSTGDYIVTSYRNLPGCIAPKTIASSKNTVIYLSQQGLYAFDGTGVVELSEDIRNLLTQELNEGKFADASGAFIEDDHYLLSVTTEKSSSPNLLISFLLGGAKPVITLWRGLPREDLGIGATGFQHTSHNLSVYSIARFPFTDGILGVIGLRGTVGKFDNSFTDNGERIRWTYGTGMLPLGDSSWQKFIRRAWLEVSPGAGVIEVRFLPDFETAGPEHAVTLLVPRAVTATGEKALTLYLPAQGAAKFWSVEFSGETDGPHPNIYGLTVEYFLRFRY